MATPGGVAMMRIFNVFVNSEAYLAYATDLVSLMTVIFTCPG